MSHDRLTENAKIYSSSKVEKINFSLNTVVLDSPSTSLRVTRTIEILILGQPDESGVEEWGVKELGSSGVKIKRET